MRIIVGLIGIPLGILMIYYRERVKRFTGNFAWAEKYFGMGGTHTAILLLGILIVIISLMYMLGTFQALLEATFGRLTP